MIRRDKDKIVKCLKEKVVGKTIRVSGLARRGRWCEADAFGVLKVLVSHGEIQRFLGKTLKNQNPKTPKASCVCWVLRAMSVRSIVVVVDAGARSSNLVLVLVFIND